MVKLDSKKPNILFSQNVSSHTEEFMYHRLLILAFCSLLLTSCLANKDKSNVVLLKHPETMDFQECSLEDWGSKEAYARKDQCVQQWEEQGYIVWGSH